MLQRHKADANGDGAGPAITIRREDYSAPAFWIDSVDLTFDLDPNKPRVLNRMTLRRNPGVAAQPLKLDGQDLNLARVLLDGQCTSFKMEGQRLVLNHLPSVEEHGTAPFALEIFTTCCPPTRRCPRCCCPTATWWPAARWKTAATSPSGSIRTKNPAICSRWLPATWWRASKKSAVVRAASICCRSMCARATWTRPSTHCRRWCTAWPGTRRASACRWIWNAS